MTKYLSIYLWLYESTVPGSDELNEKGGDDEGSATLPSHLQSELGGALGLFVGFSFWMILA